MRPFSSDKRKKNYSEFEINDTKWSRMQKQNSNFEIRKNDYKEDLFIDEITKLESIWDDLGVTSQYRRIFVENVSEINEMEKADIFEKEKINYKKLKDSLMNLKREINAREYHIKSLKQYETIIENYVLEGNSINHNSNSFKEIINIIIGLRNNAINIVNLFFNVNKIIFENINKWDLKKLHQKYLYDLNYLDKMKEDLKFLKNSILSKFIEMNNGEIDAFLTNCAPGAGIINNKLKIPLSEELMKEINNARYLLLKESILNNKDKFNKNILNQIYLNTESGEEIGNNNFIKPKKNYLNFSQSSNNRNQILKEQNNSGNININKKILHRKKGLGLNNFKDINYKNIPFHRSINKKKLKIKENNNNKLTLLNNYSNYKKPKIIIERDEINYAEMKNILIDVRNKNKIFKDENIHLKKENNDYKIKYLELKKLYDKIYNKANNEEGKRIQSEKDIDILQMKIKELCQKNQELEEKIKKNKKSLEKNENSESKEENEIIKNKKQEINYRIDFYKENISNLVNKMCNEAHLKKIPDFLKRAFIIDESIYTENNYFKGIFPKIIVSYIGEGNENINGLCSLSYENNENLNENLNLKINFIYSIEDLEKNIILIIDFIKKNINFNKLVVYLLYDNINNKFVPNKEAKDIFEKKLGFKWLCVTRDEEKNQRYIKLYISQNESEESIYNKKNKNNFFLDNYSLITINKEEDANQFKNIIKNIKMNNNKYININAIYSLLYESKELKIECLNKNKTIELEEKKQKLWKFNINKYNWNLLEEEEKKNLLNINIDNSLFKEIEFFNKNHNINIISDLQKKYISINFESIYSIIIDGIYYNRISSNKIKILKETKSNSLFFLIPSTDNTVLFYISEVNNKLKELLLDSPNNIYEQFLEFQPSTQKELFNFSMSSVRDISYIPQKLKNEQKIIYIPTFTINTHLYSFDVLEINDGLKINSLDNNEEFKLNTVDEYINVEFKPDDNINNSFSVLPVEDKRTNIIIKDPFIFGIFANDIINNDKLPLMQFLYINKDNFLMKNKYIK